MVIYDGSQPQPPANIDADIRPNAATVPASAPKLTARPGTHDLTRVQPNTATAKPITSHGTAHLASIEPNQAYFVGPIVTDDRYHHMKSSTHTATIAVRNGLTSFMRESYRPADTSFEIRLLAWHNS